MRRVRDDGLGLLVLFDEQVIFLTSDAGCSNKTMESFSEDIEVMGLRIQPDLVIIWANMILECQ